MLKYFHIDFDCFLSKLLMFCYLYAYLLPLICFGNNPFMPSDPLLEHWSPWYLFISYCSSPPRECAFFIQISFHGIPLTHSGSHSIAEIGILQPCKKVMNIFWTFLKPMKVNENNFHELMSSTNNFFDLLFL